jgi:hypothetical protein
MEVSFLLEETGVGEERKKNLSQVTKKNKL